MAETVRHVRIVGGGFTGLACAIFALQHPLVKRVELLDPSVPASTLGRGASAASAGLMHPLTRLGKEIWKGYEGYIATKELMENVERETGRTIRQSGVDIIRKGGFGKIIGADITIEGGMVLDPLEYLTGLWEYAEIQASNLGKEVIWQQGKIDSHDDLIKNALEMKECSFNNPNGNGILICAMGAGTSSHVWGCSRGLPITYELGRNLILNNDLALNKAYLRGEYVVPNHGLKKIIFGATHERENYKSTMNKYSHYQKLRSRIMSKELYSQTTELWREGKEEKILPVGAEERIGVRVKTPRTHLGRIPIAGRHSPSPSQLDCTWLITGFGSRGLIHHALVSRMVVDAALNDDPSMIPQELSINNCI